MSNQTDNHQFLNAAQVAILGVYGNGDFAYLKDCSTRDDYVSQMHDCGDGLLRFLMVELDSKEDCNDLEEASSRIRSAIEDLEGVLESINNLVDAQVAPSDSNG